MFDSDGHAAELLKVLEHADITHPGVGRQKSSRVIRAYGGRFDEQHPARLQQRGSIGDQRLHELHPVNTAS